MGIFAGRRQANVARQDAPLSRRLIVVMLGVIVLLGLTVQTEAVLPPSVLALAGGLGFLALFLTGLVRPEIPLYVLTAYLPFSKQLAGDFGGAMTALNLTNLLLVIIVMGWFTGTTTGRQPAFEGNRLHWPVFCIAVWSVISFVVNMSRLGGWYFAEYINEAKRWMDPILLYFLFFHIVQDRQRWKNLIVIMMLSVVVVSGMAIWEYHGLADSAGSLESARVYGIADNPNSLGAFFVYYMFFYAAFWLDRITQWRRWALLMPLLLCFRGIMVTFSRGAYLAFGVGCLGLSFARSKLLFLLTCAGLALALLNPWMLPEGIRYRLFESTFKDQNVQLLEAYGRPGLESRIDTSASARLVIWRGALEIIAEHPVFGVGLGQFQGVIQKHTTLSKRFDAHNAYLLAASEQGLPMVGFFIVMLLMSLRMTYRVARESRDPFIRSAGLGWFGGLSGLLVANMFGSRMNSAEVSGYFWILAALMARAHVWLKAEAREAQRPASGRVVALRPGRRLRAGASDRPPKRVGG